MDDNPYIARQTEQQAVRRQHQRWISDRNAIALAFGLSFGLLLAFFAIGALAIWWAKSR